MMTKTIDIGIHDNLDASICDIPPRQYCP